VTPDSHSVLPSVTNMTLCQLAADMGMKVERRPIDFEKEIDSFAEVAACGTAVVVTPVCSIERNGVIHKTGPETGCGPTLEKLYHAVQAIQYGEAPDTHGWNTVLA
jgi:branched-chain amino acid aminotransferase